MLKQYCVSEMFGEKKIRKSTFFAFFMKIGLKAVLSLKDTFCFPCKDASVNKVVWYSCIKRSRLSTP